MSNIAIDVGFCQIINQIMTKNIAFTGMIKGGDRNIVARRPTLYDEGLYGVITVDVVNRAKNGLKPFIIHPTAGDDDGSADIEEDNAQQTDQTTIDDGSADIEEDNAQQVDDGSGDIEQKSDQEGFHITTRTAYTFVSGAFQSDYKTKQEVKKAMSDVVNGLIPPDVEENAKSTDDISGFPIATNGQPAFTETKAGKEGFLSRSAIMPDEYDLLVNEKMITSNESQTQLGYVIDSKHNRIVPYVGVPGSDNFHTAIWQTEVFEMQFTDGQCQPQGEGGFLIFTVINGKRYYLYATAAVKEGMPRFLEILLGRRKKKNQKNTNNNNNTNNTPVTPVTPTPSPTPVSPTVPTTNTGNDNAQKADQTTDDNTQNTDQTDSTDSQPSDSGNACTAEVNPFELDIDEVPSVLELRTFDEKDLHTYCSKAAGKEFIGFFWINTPLKDAPSYALINSVRFKDYVLAPANYDPRNPSKCTTTGAVRLTSLKSFDHIKDDGKRNEYINWMAWKNKIIQHERGGGDDRLITLADVDKKYLNERSEHPKARIPYDINSITIGLSTVAIIAYSFDKTKYDSTTEMAVDGAVPDGYVIVVNPTNDKQSFGTNVDNQFWQKAFGDKPYLTCVLGFALWSIDPDAFEDKSFRVYTMPIETFTPSIKSKVTNWFSENFVNIVIIIMVIAIGWMICKIIQEVQKPPSEQEQFIFTKLNDLALRY